MSSTTPPSNTYHQGNVSGGAANYGTQNFAGSTQIGGTYFFSSTHTKFEDYFKRIESQIDPDIYLRLLDVAEQEKCKSKIPVLDPKNRSYYWINKNIDYLQWESGNGPPILWLTGERNRGMSEVAADVLVRASDQAPQPGRTVVYFFCSAATCHTIVADFAYTMLYQLSKHLGQDRMQIQSSATIFFKTLLSTVFTWNKHVLSDEDLSIATRSATDSDVATAFIAAFQTVDIKELTIVVHGLGSVAQEGSAASICRLVQHMVETTSKSRALVTSFQRLESPRTPNLVSYIIYNQERKACLESLRYADTRYAKISKKHSSSLEWLWEHEEYKKWISSEGSGLFYVEGKPGSGKSTLVKYFKENMKEKAPIFDSWTKAHYFYSERGDVEERTHSNMLKSILRGVLEQDETTFPIFQRTYREIQHREHRDWPLSSLTGLLSSFATYIETQDICLIIDAMDESDEEERYDIVQKLYSLCSQESSRRIKIFIAGRPESRIRPLPEKNRYNIRLEDENRKDIAKFSQAFLRSDLNLDENSLAEAVAYIEQHAKGVFVWIHLIRKELLSMGFSPTPAEILARLQRLPKDLDKFYEYMLERLAQRNIDERWKSVKAFQLALFVHRPLTPAEFYDALVTPDEQSRSTHEFERLDEKQIEERIMVFGGNFLEVAGDASNKNIQAMHQTARSFLLQSAKMLSNEQEQLVPVVAHRVITKTCIRYIGLSFTSFIPEEKDTKAWNKENYGDYVKHLEGRPFLNYSFSHLKEHLGECNVDEEILQRISAEVNDMACSPCFSFVGSWMTCLGNPRVKHGRKKLFYRVARTKGSRNGANDFRYKALHAAVEAGSPLVAKALIATWYRVDDSNQQNTPLWMSAAQGDDMVLKLLIDLGFDINAKDKSGKTALHYAAMNGHEPTVDCLREKKADVTLRDTSGRTPLQLALANIS